MPKASKVFRCSGCNGRFSEKDAEELKFYPSTGVCHGCYKTERKDSDSCFGKKELYSHEAVVCQQVCPDRKICYFFVRLERLDKKIRSGEET